MRRSSTESAKDPFGRGDSGGWYLRRQRERAIRDKDLSARGSNLAKSLGHSFEDGLDCKWCKRSWFDQQDEPVKCEFVELKPIYGRKRENNGQSNG